MAQSERTRKNKLLALLAIIAMNCVIIEAVPIADIEGYRVETSDGFRMSDQVFVIAADQEIVLRLFGRGLNTSTAVSFTPVKGDRGENCDDHRTTEKFKLTAEGLEDETALITVNLPLLEPDESYFRFCVKQTSDDSQYHNDTAGLSENLTTPIFIPLPSLSTWVHQGDEEWLRISTEKISKTLLPLWLQIIFIVILLFCSGLFSGLNLGLMSLDKTELEIVKTCGSSREKKYAKTIAPLRKRGNYLLCTILLGNVLVNNTLTILLDDLSGSGLAAVFGATAAIVLFGEIIPQAVCSRYGLAIGARTIWFTKFFMVLTFPVSFPISKVLDWILGEEIGTVYNRDRLRELLRVTYQSTDLMKDEVNIIRGALELSKKTAKDIMTNLEDVYMIDYNTVLDFDAVSEIMKTGYSRIPIYDKEPKNIVALLNIKDLAFVDPDDKTPLQTVCKFYNHPINFVFEDEKLDVLLEDFKAGQSHLSFVRRVNNEGPGDPFYETLGVVTLEDVIEEIIQSEIVDETDTVVDNRSKARRKAQAKDFTIFSQPADENYTQLTPQLALATFQFLSTSVLPFKPECLSEVVLQRLLKQNIVVDLRLTDQGSSDPLLYKRGDPCDYFIIVLQGKVEVDIGKEHMKFNGGPFMYFGCEALNGVIQPMSKHGSLSSFTSCASDYHRQPPYTPDYTVRALTDLQYLKVRRYIYLAAWRATQIERHPKLPEHNASDDHFEKELKRAASLELDADGDVIRPVDQKENSSEPEENNIHSRENKEKNNTSDTDNVPETEHNESDSQIEGDTRL